jgi:C_GCAxxG_C_C family probable redox protein
MVAITTLEQRIARAHELHAQGYNCSQCVVMVFDDIHKLGASTSAHIAAGLGRGVGGCMQTCGAVTGMAIASGWIAYNAPSDKQQVYHYVHSLADEFKTMNGSTICGELLKPGRKPCIELISDAITILHNKLNK